MGERISRRPRWPEVSPPAALVALALVWGRHPGTLVLVLVAVVLGVAVLAAVHHAEMVALRVGEPFGSLVLAVAVLAGRRVTPLHGLAHLVLGAVYLLSVFSG